MKALGRRLRRIWDVPLGLAPAQKLAVFVLAFFSSLFVIASVNEMLLYYYNLSDFESFLFTGEIFTIYHVSSPFVWIWGSLVALWAYRRPRE